MTSPSDQNLEPQSVCSPITSSAIFMVATLAPGSDSAEAVRSWCADIAGLVRSVGKRVPAGNLTCVAGFGSKAWDALFGGPRPAALHPFFAIWGLMKFLERFSTWPFVIYRAVLGVFLIVAVSTGLLA